MEVWSSDVLVYLSPWVSTATEYNVSVQLDATLSSPQHQTFTVLDDPLLNSFDNDPRTHVGDVLQLQVSALLASLSFLLVLYTFVILPSDSVTSWHLGNKIHVQTNTGSVQCLSKK